MSKELKKTETVQDVKTVTTKKLVGKNIISHMESSGPANYEGVIVGTFTNSVTHTMSLEGAQLVYDKLFIDVSKIEKQVRETKAKIEALDLKSIDETLMKRMQQFEAWKQGEQLKEQLKAQEDMLSKLNKDTNELKELLKKAK